MSSVTSRTRGAPYTNADLEQMPDDGRRYEIIDGVLIVTPAPTWPHQRVVGRLFSLLMSAAPSGTEAMVAPLDVRLAEDSVLQPDVLVLRQADLGARTLDGLPLLAVEVLSPSTRRIDLNVKVARYEAAGVPAYWVIDPDEPRLIAWDLHDGAYVQVADVRGDTAYEATLPYPVTVVPEKLVAG